MTQRDIRELQVAKGAVATAVEVLLGHLGIGPGELDEILLAGAFGAAIDPASARAIGLVPDLPVERVRFVGNAALEGARMATLSFRERQMAFALPSRVGSMWSSRPGPTSTSSSWETWRSLAERHRSAISSGGACPQCSGTGRRG